MFKKPLFQNILALYGVQLVNYLLPLVTIPYLARVLGAEGWGLVAFTQGFAAYLIVIIEYGFDLSATREVARYRNDTAKLSDLVAGVLGAKLILAAAAVALAVTVMPWIPNAQDHFLLFWAGTILAVSQGLSMLWYFQGQERMKVVARLDIVAKVLATISLLVFVREPADAWKVLGLMAAGSMVSTGIALAILYREVPFRFPNRSMAAGALRLGWSMFVFRSGVSLYTVGNAFILGLYVPPQFVGYYAGAEKISRAVLGLFQPVSQALFPRISRLIRENRDLAARYARISFRVMGGTGLVGGVIMYASAPLIVSLLLGPDFEPAVTVVRLLALLPPLIAASNVLGLQWMLPLGLDKSFNAIIVGAGVCNVALAFSLAPAFGHIGMASAVVACEVLVTASMIAVLWRRNLSPFSRAFAPDFQNHNL